MAAPGEQNYGWSHLGGSQGGPYGEHYGQPQGVPVPAPAPAASPLLAPWRSYQHSQPAPHGGGLGPELTSYPPPDMVPSAPHAASDFPRHAPLYPQQPQLYQHPQQPQQYPYPQQTQQYQQHQSQQHQQPQPEQQYQHPQYPLAPQPQQLNLQPQPNPEPQMQYHHAPDQTGPSGGSHHRSHSRSRSRERDRDGRRDRDWDRDRDRGHRDRDRDYNGRHVGSIAEWDAGRDRDGGRRADDETRERDRDREYSRDREWDRREDEYRRGRSSRRSRSPDRHHRSSSRSRNRSDHGRDGDRDRDRHDRDRWNYDRSSRDRGRDDDRGDRDRGRDDRDRRDDRRYGRGGDDSYGRRRYPTRMEQELEAGLDGVGSAEGRRSRSAEPEDTHEGGGGAAGGAWRGRRDPPSNTVLMRNIPEDRDETELHQLLEGFPGLVTVKLVRHRITGASRGSAFVEFASEADAAVLMETKARYSLQIGGQTLRLEYAHGGATQLAAGPALDWICDMCSVVNFARRVECHKCSTARPSNPQRAAAEANAPSPILKVSNLEPEATDDDLRSLFLAHVSVKDVRLVLDKYTGLPRGLAFVEMFSTNEAARALGLLQGAVPPGSTQPLRLCYARDKFGGVGGAPEGTAAGAEALEAAQAMSMYSNWEPKAFDARALDGKEDQETQQKQEGISQGPEQRPQTGYTATASGSAPAASQAAQSESQTPAGFVYDQASGYWYDAASGYYYDANTCLYYHRSTNQWYSYDHATGQYAAVGGGNASTDGASNNEASQPQAAAAVVSTAATGASASRPSTSAAAATKAGAGGAPKRAGAVIGAAPVLNAQGLLAAAALAEEKSKMAQKAQAKAAAKAQAQQQARLAAAATQAPAAPAQVQGVIHRGKWSQRAQQ